MAKSSSRLLVVKKNDVALLGVQSKGVSVAKSSIDVTSDEDDGYRVLLDVAGTKTLDISISGVTTDDVLRGLIMTNSSQLLTDISIEYPNGDTITGDFYLGDLSESGDSPDSSVAFTGNLMSSGVWTYTPTP